VRATLHHQATGYLSVYKVGPNYSFSGVVLKINLAVLMNSEYGKMQLRLKTHKNEVHCKIQYLAWKVIKLKTFGGCTCSTTPLYIALYYCSLFAVTCRWTAKIEQEYKSISTVERHQNF